MNLQLILQQEEKVKNDTIAKYGAYYYTRRDTYGYGYFIGVYKKGAIPSRTELNHLINKDVADGLVRYLNSGTPIEAVVNNKSKFNLIAVFHEKHGDRYFIVPTRADLEKVALKIVLERNEEGWYDFEQTSIEKPKILLDDAKTYGGQIGLGIRNSWADYERSQRINEENLSLQDLLDKVVKNKDTKAALQLLEESKNGEYEGFEVVKGESCDYSPE